MSQRKLWEEAETNSVSFWPVKGPPSGIIVFGQDRALPMSIPEPGFCSYGGGWGASNTINLFSH